MKAKITAIRDAGDLQKERVVIKVTEATDIGSYLLIKTASRDGIATTGVTETFWFPDKDISTGDYVVVYTKQGKGSDKEFKGAISHFFYWGKSETIWNESGFAAVLLQTNDWASFPVVSPEDDFA